MRKLKKGIVVSLITIITMFTIAGCSSGNTEPADTNNEVTTSTAETEIVKTEKEPEIDYTGYKEYYFNGYRFMIPEDWNLFMDIDGMYDFSTEDKLGIVLFSYEEDNASYYDEMSEFETLEYISEKEDSEFNGFHCVKWSAIYLNDWWNPDKYPYFHDDCYLFDDNLMITLSANDDEYGRDIVEKILNSIEKID